MQIRTLGQEDPLEEAWQITPVSCLENPMDRGAWQATVHGVPNSPTGLKQLSMHASSSNCSSQDRLLNTETSCLD